MEKTVKNIENVVISVQKLTQMPSTSVENVRQINLFLQNKPNFPHFSLKNEDFTKKQTQFKPNSNPILAQKSGWQTQFKAKQTQLLKRPKMNARNYITMNYENFSIYWIQKTNPNKANFTCPQKQTDKNALKIYLFGINYLFLCIICRGKTMAEELVGIIGGTGLGDALAEHILDAEFHNINTPFGRPSTAIMVGKIGQKRVAFLNRHGKGHRFSPSEVPSAANIFALKKLGVHTVISSGAVGSLKEEIAPGNLIIVDQFIDKTFRRINTFFGGFGAVHCEMAQPVCRRLREILVETAKGIDIKTHPKGIYVCMEGPQFSTRAESLMHKSWGADLIGMTAMPEAKLAREAQICYVLIALASDYDCWKPHEEKKNKQTLLKEIIDNLQVATCNCLELIKAVLASEKSLVFDDCHCRKSLELAVWTNQNQIAMADKEKLKVLFE
jgi:5'-methylthioadenosine phosphorylase